MNNRREFMPKTVKSWWWIALALVLVGSATLAYQAQPARAQSPRRFCLPPNPGGQPRHDGGSTGA